MKITIEKLKELKACEDGLDWFAKSGSEDLLETLLKVNDYNPSYSRWLFTKLMNLKQLRQIAVYSAEQVLPIFEAAYPNDKRPREAIAAAKAVIECDSEENIAKAKDAAYAAYACAATAATAAYAAAYAAAHAATYAATAATAAYAAAYAAADKKELQVKIIYEAVRLLEEK